ncbi:MAG TPA: glycosyltransferase family 39 protein, partial [Bacteroidia bacterium]
VVDQAVAWIPGRNDILLAIFVLSSFIFLLNYLETKKRKDLLWHLVFFGCALFTKENGIVLPVLFMFYLIFITKDKSYSTFNIQHSTFLKLGVGYVAFLIPWFLLRRMALTGSISDNSIHSGVLGIINNAPFMLQYIGKAILPFNLSVMCMMEDANVLQEIIAIAIIVAGIFFSKNKRWSFVWFGIGWFVLFLVPSLSARLVEGLEHRLYVPIIGFIILAASPNPSKGGELSAQSSPLRGDKRGALLIAYILVLLFITNSRLPLFKNGFSFNLSAVQSSKYTVTPCLDLAADYQTSGKKELAIEMYKIALYRDSVYGILHPNRRQSYYPILHDNLGVLYLDKQQYAAAEQQFVLAVACGDVYAMYHLANVYFKTNRTEQAATLWKKVLTIQPDQPDFKDAYLHLANYAKAKGDTAGFNQYVKAFKVVNSQ